MPRSHKGGADGVVSSAGLSKGRRTDHPVRDKSEHIHFFDVADTPPLRGGECARRKTLSKKLKVAALLHKIPCLTSAAVMRYSYRHPIGVKWRHSVTIC